MANELMNTFDSGTDIVTRASFNARIEQANTNFVSGLDGKINAVQHTGTFLSTGWVGASAPYTQTISVPGMIIPLIRPTAEINLTGVYATDQSLLAEFAKIYNVEAGVDEVTAYANSIPSLDISATFVVLK